MCAGLLVLSCSDPRPGPAGESYQLEVTSFVSTPQLWLWILVIDDAPGKDAQRMREVLAGQLSGWNDQHHSWDPARFAARRIEVLLVPASDPTRALHPGNLPALKLDLPNATSAHAEDWESAVAEGLLSLDGNNTGPPKLFDAFSYWADVLEGTLAAPDVQSQHFVDTLPDELSISALIAASRDDASLGQAPEPQIGDHFVDAGVCSDQLAGNFEARLTDFGWGVQTCSEPFFERRGVAEVFPTCQEGAIVRRESGQRACRIMGYTNAETDCPAQFGWMDPQSAQGAREPSVVERESGGAEPELMRACELVQLEGEALTSCESELSCAGCAPGWCFRQPELSEDYDWFVMDCAARSQWSWEQLRFTFGSDTAFDAVLEITCEVATGP